MKEVKAPKKIDLIDCEGCEDSSVFLAGSIEMGKAGAWQKMVVRALRKEPITILNPRRDNWDVSLEQKIDNAQFREQVEWELEAMEKATVIAMYFDPNTKSPISLLELGLFANSKKLIVYCPDGFWRKGNVDIICRKYKITQCVSMEDFILQISKELK